jgi:preprotein translocase subunit SecA
MPVGDTRTTESRTSPQAHTPDTHATETHTPGTHTTIDEIEREFARRKKKELEQARTAGSNGNGASGQVGQRRTGEKVGRNDPCPCGSGLKFKKCHGKDGADGD